MSVRTASCRCGQLRAQCESEPVRVSVCHCLGCQQRSGSAFAAQARWPHAQVTITGEHKEWRGVGGGGTATRFRFCPECGSTVTWVNESSPDTVAVALGAFADPAFPAPSISIYEERKHQWVEIVGDIEHD